MLNMNMFLVNHVFIFYVYSKNCEIVFSLFTISKKMYGGFLLFVLILQTY